MASQVTEIRNARERFLWTDESPLERMNIHIIRDEKCSNGHHVPTKLIAQIHSTRWDEIDDDACRDYPAEYANSNNRHIDTVPPCVLSCES